MRAIAINEMGRRIGEDHHKAVLTNAEVELLLQMRDEGMSYGQLAVSFEVSKSTIQSICTGRRRCQIVARHKTILVV